ncbi:MAG TPA: response regulator [Bacteroidales bacterium]|nr:response regulator [Bacteroidales bacterium]
MNPAFLMFNQEGYVLAVEDSAVQARQLQRLLEQFGMRCVVARNGKEGFEQVQKERPMLIISDVVMPEMDGYTFCQLLKSDKQYCDIPFMLLTSLSDPLDIIKGLQSGADNFITKPYEEKYLISRINYLLTNKMMRDISPTDMNMEVMFQNQKFIINSDKKQILDLLLSVYEAAMARNSQLVEAQRQLQLLNEDLKRANAELEAFAHTVSHDLRGPLNGIQGFLGLLEADYGRQLDEQAMEYIHWIRTAATGMSNLITDLLNFSRSSRAEIHPVEVDLSVMAAEIVDDLRLSTYKAAYRIDIQPGIKVTADNPLMRVLLINLLGNALKYSQNTPDPHITFGMTYFNGRNVMYVKDNGAGFDMSKASQLFKPFVRLHSSEQFQGTGIGLSTVKRIIDRHKGEVWCESEPGKGSVFYFTLGT